MLGLAEEGVIAPENEETMKGAGPDPCKVTQEATSMKGDRALEVHPLQLTNLPI